VTGVQTCAFRSLYSAAGFVIVKALVVIIYGNSENLFGVFLTNHILVESFFDLFRNGQLLCARLRILLLNFLPDDVIAEINTLVTDKDRRAGDKLANFMLTLATEGTIEQLAAVVTFVETII
jgi:hypothetical protein